MITQWDISSKINPQTSAICYSLLIDGTEQDARLIVKKLEGYVQTVRPAAAPFVYCLDLPQDLDVDVLEKIRVAVREGIEQAKKVNELVPGGTLGNPLFTSDIDREDKAFPTFLTLDPSQSFFDKKLTDTQHAPSKMVSIDLDAPIDTLQETPAQPLQSSADTSLEAQELVVPAAKDDLLLDVQSVETPDLPEQLADQITVPPLPTTPQKQEDSRAVATDNTHAQQHPSADMSDQPIDDILLAATRYDMFLDLNKLDEQAAALKENQEQKEEVPPPQTAKKANSFNIFEQQLKEQTCFMDLQDIESITERITQKDLDFAQHAAVAADIKNELKSATNQPVQKFGMRQSLTAEKDATVVLDPFEQLLAASASGPATTTPKAPAAAPSAPPETVQAPVVPVITKKSEQQMTQQVSAPPENRVGKDAQTFHTEKKIMQEPNNKKPLFRLKHKEPAPQQPAAPLPPLPPAPQKPAAPVPPAPVPPAPVPPAPVPPAPVPPKPVTPAPAATPATEPPHQIFLRKRRPQIDPLDKTQTIDHSIQMPLSDLKKHNWPLEVPLIPTYTLEKMTISINRFAHATAISVIDNPGKLYNPLVLHGATGTGKTHFLHAIGYELSKKFGQENIFVTNGVRLSRGIQRYMMEGNLPKFEKFISSVKALLIDDIHLISVNEQNREQLSKLLNTFRAQNKQIVITSKYPPENLAKLEELLNFKLDSGWISDLKQANGPARNRIIQQMLANNNIELSNEDINRFFGHSNMSLGTVARSIRRVRVLEKLIFPNSPIEKRSPLFIFDQLLATKGEDQESLITQKSPNDIHSAPVSGNGEWGRIGFFYPQNHSNMMNWLVFALQQRAKELGIPGGPELAVRSSYSTENIISSAFKIANLCDNKKLKSAVILGPSFDVCEPSVRENFYDILTHMLEIMLIRCGVINFEDANSPSTYVKILSELLR